MKVTHLFLSIVMIVIIVIIFCMSGSLFLLPVLLKGKGKFNIYVENVGQKLLFLYLLLKTQHILVNVCDISAIKERVSSSDISVPLLCCLAPPWER